MKYGRNRRLYRIRNAGEGVVAWRNHGVAAAAMAAEMKRDRINRAIIGGGSSLLKLKSRGVRGSMAGRNVASRGSSESGECHHTLAESLLSAPVIEIFSR